MADKRKIKVCGEKKLKELGKSKICIKNGIFLFWSGQC